MVLGYTLIIYDTKQTVARSILRVLSALPQANDKPSIQLLNNSTNNSHGL